MFFIFFFFKQKTAYEITRRDWSSDVCSSDLRCVRTADPAPPESGDQQAGGRTAGAGSADRKSVVEGKSVPCGVDLGGRRIMKKKNATRVGPVTAARPGALPGPGLDPG